MSNSHLLLSTCLFVSATDIKHAVKPNHFGEGRKGSVSFYWNMLRSPPLPVKSFTWMAVRPLGKSPHQPILRGQDEAPVLVIVCILEHI